MVQVNNLVDNGDNYGVSGTQVINWWHICFPLLPLAIIITITYELWII